MTNALPHSDIRNHNGRFWKWVTGVLGGLLVMALIGLVGTIRNIEHLETTQVEVIKDVDKNAQWIADWSAVLKVPERDQKQDSDIQRHDSDIEELKRRVVALEGR